ncbi:MAG TPA: sulfite reductase flavoprotein subunit alpha [Luteitalea sp.]|nr:sulfite reductase flavoprotein subunit alpha [Luteitalea sp.]
MMAISAAWITSEAAIATSFAMTRDPGRLTWAAALLVFYVAFSLIVVGRHWRRARRATAAARSLVATTGGIAPTLVVHASQTGTAAEVAQATARALEEAGLPTAVVDIRHLDAPMLSAVKRVLLVASTTGEGDPPDGADRFVRTVMHAPLALDGVTFGVLALGDRTYRHYCAFGHALDAWLRASGARPLFPLIDVDRHDDAALARWQDCLSVIGGARVTMREARCEAWSLVTREHVNPDSPGGPAYHLALAPPSGTTWQAGDVLIVQPQHTTDRVSTYLTTVALDGEAPVEDEGHVVPLRQALRRRDLVAVTVLGDAAAVAPASLLEALPMLPSREYSIASVADDGHVDLLVRQVRRPDGHLGLGSGWLTAGATVGGDILARVRENAAFHGPASTVPLVLIGAGTGIAGLRAHLAARAHQPGRGPAWLLFGERSSAHDRPFDADLRLWQQQGVLTRLDRAYSRDAGDGRYVQDLVRGAAGELRRWVAAGAMVMVCGSREGMADGVDRALHDVLGAAGLAELSNQDRYRRDVY